MSGERLNPRITDVHCWRETFAERRRGQGTGAEATRQAMVGLPLGSGVRRSSFQPGAAAVGHKRALAGGRFGGSNLCRAGRYQALDR